MRTILIFILAHLVIKCSFSQTTEVLKKAGNIKLTKANDFAFIEPRTDSTGYSFVATYKVSGKKKQGNIADLFFIIARRAKEDGANCFKLNYFNRVDSLDETTLILDTYYWNDSMRIVNFNNHEQNCIYIFGDDKAGNRTISFKLDNKKTDLKPGTYFKYVRTEGKEVKINKGGFTGATMMYTLNGNKPDIFLTLSGFGLGGGPMPPGTMGASFNTGRISAIDGDLGCLLKTLFTQVE